MGKGTLDRRHRVAASISTPTNVSKSRGESWRRGDPEGNRRTIERALARTGGNAKAAVRLLGVSRGTVLTALRLGDPSDAVGSLGAGVVVKG